MDLRQRELLRQQADPDRVMVELDPYRVKRFPDHLIVVESQLRQPVEIEPRAGLGHQVRLRNRLRKIRDGIETDRDGLVKEPVVPLDPYSGGFKPFLLVEFIESQPGRVTEGLELLQEEVVDPRPLPDIPAGRLNQLFRPPDIASRQAPAFSSRRLISSSFSCRS